MILLAGLNNLTEICSVRSRKRDSRNSQISRLLAPVNIIINPLKPMIMAKELKLKDATSNSEVRDKDVEGFINEMKEEEKK